MIELSDEMRTRLASALEDKIPVTAASIESDGYPKVSFYGSVHVHSKDQLALWHRNPDAGLMNRLADNPRMAFLYRHPSDRVSWQFFGRARVVEDPKLQEQIYNAIPEMEKLFDQDRKGKAVIIDLDRVVGRGVEMVRDSAKARP